MNTLTLTQRYGLPAFIAAALHVVLFFAVVPGVPEIVIAAPPALPKLPPFPPQIREVPLTPPDPVVASAGVKPLAGGAPRPTGVDHSVLRDDGILVAMDPVQVPRPDVPITVVPHAPSGPGGPGDAVWGDTTPTLFTPAMLDRIPRTVAQPAPDYPLALRQAGVEGEVVIEFDVDTTGRVITARVAQGGLPEFEQAALRAVLRWRFEPGRRDGRIVPFRMAVPIGFRVSEE